MIPVNHTWLPPREQANAYLDRIWQTGVATNNGPLIQELEERLRSHLGVKHLYLVNSGTTALQLALRTLPAGGEILTTPFSFVASLDAILWEGFEARFADIDPETLCLSPEEVRKHIGPKTRAILPTHVYGNSCDLEAFAAIEKEFGIPVIYDGAHAFGTQYKGKSVLQSGHISCLSLHAYKILHMVEGGAVITENDEVAEQLFRMRYFGKNRQNEVQELGINAKSSEFHAAIGLCGLDNFPRLFQQRKTIAEQYRNILREFPLRLPELTPGATWNHAYFPILLDSEADLLRFSEALSRNGVKTRRYFHPSLNTLSLGGPHPEMPVSEDAARRVLCLPIHNGLDEKALKQLEQALRQTLQAQI